MAAEEETAATAADSGYDPIVSARFTALHVALEIVKLGPVGADALAVVLDKADEIFAWLMRKTAPEATS